jgi:transposase
MVVVGADVHQRTHTFVAVDEVGRKLGEKVVAATSCGPAEAVMWARGSRRADKCREAAFARHAGVAPIPVWSGNTAGRVRMTRSGNRQLHAALHRIAVTRVRLEGLGRTYYRARLAAGDSSTEARRCLKRRLARVVFHHLHIDQQHRQQPCQPAAA